MQKLVLDKCNCSAEGRSPDRSVGASPASTHQYELSDWLGNVRVVINDRKTPVNTGNVTVSYMPQVLSTTDYYSFGSQIAERTYDPVKPTYRFGFNTQEKVFEITQDHYTAKFWEYDARLGRRWNVDPVKKPRQSSYTILSNNPIWRIDPNGDDDYYDKKGKYIGSYGENNGIMRVVESKEIFENVVKSGQHQGKIIIVDYSTIETFKHIANNTFATGKEWSAIIIFDPKNAVIKGELFYQGSNYSNKESKVPIKSEFEKLNPGLILIATAHAHPKIENSNEINISGPSKKDIESVLITQVPDYQIDAYDLKHVATNYNGGMGNISVVDLNKKVTKHLTNLGNLGLGTNKFNIGKDALERHGGKHLGKIDDINNNNKYFAKHYNKIQCLCLKCLYFCITYSYCI